jgi:Glycosyltransferase family 87
VKYAATTALGAVALVAAVWGILHVGWYASVQIVDYGVYQHYATAIVDQHAVPYRDFDLEYPPGALPVFAAPELVHSNYQQVFQVLMAFFATATVCGVAAIGGRRAAALAAVAPLALGSVVLSRFDFWPAALAVWGVAALLRKRPLLAGVLLGTAFAAKLWPAALVPLALVWLVRNCGVRAGTTFVGAAVATAAAWFLPFVAVAPGGVGASFHEQLARPLQLESLGGAMLIAIHKTAGSTLHMIGSYGSQNLAGPGADAAAVATSVVGGLALVAVWVSFVRGPATVERLLAYAAASIAVPIAFGKVFSPQFLIWLIPFVPLVRARRGALAQSLFFVALLLTQLWFPHHYWELVNLFASPYWWILLARDLVVVALAVVLVWPPSEHEVLGEHRSRLEALQRARAEVQ